MGFALAIGVAIDAFVVRMTIVPAVISLLGRRAWWLPGWLSDPAQRGHRGRAAAAGDPRAARSGRAREDMSAPATEDRPA